MPLTRRTALIMLIELMRWMPHPTAANVAKWFRWNQDEGGIHVRVRVLAIDLGQEQFAGLWRPVGWRRCLQPGGIPWAAGAVACESSAKRCRDRGLRHVASYDPSVTRLYLLRACYLPLVVGLAMTTRPLILFDAAT